MNRFTCSLLVGSLTALCACFSPNYGNSGFMCSADGECPSGYECLSDGICHRDGTSTGQPDANPNTPDADPNAPDADPSAPDAGMLDAATDASPPTACDTAVALTEGVPVAGTTIGADDDLDLTCLATDSTNTVHEFTLAADRAVLVTVEPTTDWDLATSLRESTNCEVSTDLSCIAGAFATRYFNRPNQAAGTYDVVIDGLNGANGDYTITYETRPVDTQHGYWLSKSEGGTYTPLTTAAITLPEGDGDEGVIPGVNLGFTFPFYGTNQGTINIHTNGFASFNALNVADLTNLVTECPLDQSTPFNTIAPFWADMHMNTGTLKIETQGVQPFRRFVIEWAGFGVFEAAPCAGAFCEFHDVQLNHQAILYENGDIEFRYGPRSAVTVGNNEGCATPELGCSATIGLRNANGLDIDNADCDDDIVTSGTVFYYAHPTL